jgi:hypothetical protein
MKRTIYPIALFLLLVTRPTAVPQPPSGPSLQETLTFVSQNLIFNALWHYDTGESLRVSDIVRWTGAETPLATQLIVRQERRDDSTYRDRSIKAMKHAVELAAGKSSAFEQTGITTVAVSAWNQSNK